jgi:phosphonate transport system substrate-binding protein
VEAVADQVAQGGAVESYIWTMISRLQPELTAKTKIIERSPSFGFPPIVAHVGIPGWLRTDMAAALTNMHNVPAGRALLGELGLDGFGGFPMALFDDIAAMAEQMGRVSSAAGSVLAKQGG